MGEFEEFADAEQREYIRVQDGGDVFYVEAVALSSEEEVAARLPTMEEFRNSLRTVADTVTDGLNQALTRVRPKKVTVEFGCEIGVESGKLTAVLVKGSAKANVKIVLEWAPGEQP
ncbi:CU044_2847 family protein [Streptomyces fuscichromogenes]|uniref:CU044_2847 family protein n=1 Tax=Streptomyces fuscichromogenes TaxID=1324013 RepID=UPI003810512B